MVIFRIKFKNKPVLAMSCIIIRTILQPVFCILITFYCHYLIIIIQYVTNRQLLLLIMWIVDITQPDLQMTNNLFSKRNLFYLTYTHVLGNIET